MDHVRVLLLADTHVPKRARALPDEVWRAVDEAEVVVHAGDWVEPALLDDLEERSRRLVAVYGNNDGPELRRRLPEVARARIGDLRFGVIHETGPASGREARCDQMFEELDVLVFGHSHIPWDTVTPGGLRLLNPGSPTDRRRQPRCTYMTLTAGPAGVEDLRLHELPLRSPGGRRGGAPPPRPGRPLRPRGPRPPRPPGGPPAGPGGPPPRQPRSRAPADR